MEIDTLLADSRIWRGHAAGAHAAGLATGFEALDAYFPAGGWPPGALIEVFVEHYGIGELALFMPALSRLSHAEAPQKNWIVWLAPPFIPYAPALIQHGIKLGSLLFIRASRDKKDDLWALEQCLRSGACGLILGWLLSVQDRMLRRFQVLAQENACSVVLFRPISALRSHSVGLLRLRLIKDASGTSIDILKCRGRPARLIRMPHGLVSDADRHAGRTKWR
jgi:hypothetical protein